MLENFRYIPGKNSYVMLTDTLTCVETYHRDKFAHCPLDQALPMLVRLQRNLQQKRKPQNFLRLANPILEFAMYNEFLRNATNPDGTDTFTIEALLKTLDECLRDPQHEHRRVYTIPKPANWKGCNDPSKIASLGNSTSQITDALAQIKLIGELLEECPGLRIPPLPLPRRVRTGRPTWPLTLAISEAIRTVFELSRYVTEYTDKMMRRPTYKVNNEFRNLYLQPSGDMPKLMVHQIDQYSNEWKKYAARYNGDNPAKNMTLYDWALLSRCVDEQTLNAGPEVIRTIIDCHYCPN